MLLMVHNTYQALFAAFLFTLAGCAMLFIGQNDAGMVLIGFAGGTGLVGRREPPG